MEFYLHFNLPMDRSPGFGSIATNFMRAIHTRFPYAFGTEYLKLADNNNSSPPGVLFTFPSRYCSSIGHQVVFRLGGWSPRFPTGFHVSRGTLDPVH